MPSKTGHTSNSWQKKPGIVINLYTNGKIVFGGANQAERTRVEEYLGSLEASLVVKPIKEYPAIEVSGTRIGTDEVGKGDYFGPLVVGGAIANEAQAKKLQGLGVKDSKALSDTTIENLAVSIRKKRWPKLQGELFDTERYCYHVIATNREEPAPEVVGLHNQRGQMENFIKELKEGFGMGWMPCGETYANAVFFRIGVIAYNLFQAMKLLSLPRWWRTSTIATVRWRLYQTAAKVVHHAHQVLLKLAASAQKIEVFLQVRSRCLQVGYG